MRDYLLRLAISKTNNAAKMTITMTSPGPNNTANMGGYLIYITIYYR